MVALEDRVAELVEKTERAVILFYQEKQEGYQELDKVFEIMMELINFLENIPEQEGSKEFLEEITVTVREAFEALEKKDSRGLADILQKRILGILKKEKEKGFVLGNYYEENIEAMKNYDVAMYEKYIAWKKEKSEFEIEEVEAEDGNWVLRLRNEKGDWFLNSGVCPQKEAEAWGESLSFKSLEQVVLLFGLGNGLIVETLWEKGASDMRLIIYEPSLEIFDYLMHRARISDIFAQERTMLLVNGLKEKSLYVLMDACLAWNNLPSLQALCHPVYSRIFTEQYTEYKNEVREGMLRTRLEFNTDRVFGKEIVRNTLSCMEYLKNAQYLEQYIGRFAPEIPAIIVAAGPSLDLNIDLLKEAKGKAVIIAADTAMRELVKHQIEPDFIATIDPKKRTEHLENKECQEVPLLCSDLTNRKILENHKGMKIFYCSSSYFKELKPDKIPDDKNYSAGPSVATMAFSICATWGFKTVIMVGQDLAYRNGASHVGGRMKGEVLHGKWQVEVEDIYGNMIKTRHEWYVFIHWFEDAIAQLKDQMTVVDATEGGAKIHGSEIMPLSEAIEKYCVSSIDCKRLVEEIPLAFEGKEYQRVVQYIEKSVDDNDKIYVDTKNVIVKTKKLISFCKKGQHGKEYNKLVKEIFKLGERIMERPVWELLESWITEKKGDLKDIYSLEEENEINVYEGILKTYENLNQAAKEIKPILAEAYAKMKENQ